MRPDEMEQAALAIGASALVSAGLIAAMLASGRAGTLDEPNQRSLHERPVPRSGGLGVLAAVAIGLAVAAAPPALAAAVALLALVSWYDDQTNLSVRLRFAIHFAAAGLVAVGGALPNWNAAALGMAVIGIVWMTNLYNFMDGMNGLAGGMAVFGFGALGSGAWAGGDVQLAVLCACISAGAAGFLAFNFHPARIFMGDVGSIPLGFLAAALGLMGVGRGLWPLWFPPLVFAPFVVDATVTLGRRALRGEKVWHAHREHYYQRLVRMGWSHRRTALAEYALMIVLAGLALGLRDAAAPAQAAGLVLAAAGGLAIAVAVDLRWRRFQARGGEQ